jgi:gamma-glutamyltranspeptidase/glutathione hydrolase
VYICAVDAEGNAASLIQNLYGIFGSCVVAGKSGIVLQNRSAYFSLVPAHPNHLAPGKRPLHTLIASLAFRDDKLWQVFGCMGADGQPQIQLQAYVSMIDFGLNVQQAIESPRWLSGRFAMGEPRNLLNIEGRYPERTLKRRSERRALLRDGVLSEKGRRSPSRPHLVFLACRISNPGPHPKRQRRQKNQNTLSTNRPPSSPLPEMAFITSP